MSNILLLSAGRRVELAQAFQAECRIRGLPTRLLATDFRPEFSAACQIVDLAIRAPRVTDPAYADFLLRTCLQHSVELVVPTIDTELLLLSQLRQQFQSHGIHVIVSDEALVSACRDKRLTARFFEEFGIDTPRIHNKDRIEFPCFAKPYDGSSSVGIAFIPDAASVTDAMLCDEKLLFMEFIDGTHKEFTVDAYYGQSGELRCLVPRERIEVRSGEVSKSVTRKNFVYDRLCRMLSHIPGARGCLTMQFFVNLETKRLVGIEINPRFGGGYPLSYSAGANYPGMLIDEYLLRRKVAKYDDWESDLMMLRYDAKVLVHGAD
jgi:carbamoyl-phosphate synthase large subunit